MSIETTEAKKVLRKGLKQRKLGYGWVPKKGYLEKAKNAKNPRGHTFGYSWGSILPRKIDIRFKTGKCSRMPGPGFGYRRALKCESGAKKRP